MSINKKISTEQQEDILHLGGNRMKKTIHFWSVGLVLLLALMPMISSPVWAQVSSKVVEKGISDLSKAVSQEMIQHTTTSTTGITNRAQVNIQRKDKSKRWVFGSAVILAPKQEGIYPEGWLYVAKKDRNKWQVALEGSETFYNLVQNAPSTVMTDREKKVFASQGSVHTMADNDQLRLPFAIGATWSMSGGPHGWAGTNTPYSSIDLTGGDQRVLAAGGGNAYTMCGNGLGWIRVIHSNGYATDYYHLWNNIRPNGGWVNAGTYLGDTGTDTSCGGAASGRHVHFALRYNNAYASLNEREIGGWVFKTGSAYNGYAMHGSTIRYPGEGLYNYGSLASNQGIVDTNGGGTVNLRSGPGTNYSLVGTKPDGEIVTVSCTAYGTYHTGRWGTTNLWDKLSNGQWMSDAYLWTGSASAIAPPCN